MWGRAAWVFVFLENHPWPQGPKTYRNSWINALLGVYPSPSVLFFCRVPLLWHFDNGKQRDPVASSFQILQDPLLQRLVLYTGPCGHDNTCPACHVTCVARIFLGCLKDVKGNVHKKNHPLFETLIIGTYRNYIKYIPKNTQKSTV